MNTNRNNSPDQAGAQCKERSIHEALLRSEVHFWLDMIDSSHETEPPESVERMRFALALAEMRLASLPEIYPESDSDKHHDGSNVYSIDRARRSFK
jgi:hypothetical protein